VRLLSYASFPLLPFRCLPSCTSFLVPPSLRLLCPNTCWGQREWNL
jgi:hypothetical protein